MTFAINTKNRNSTYGLGPSLIRTNVKRSIRHLRRTLMPV